MKKTEKIILGTVQLGLPYGINNTAGKVDMPEAFKILDLAKEHGIAMLDTAEAYGNAIEVIGKYHATSTYRFRIISKFKFLPGSDLKINVQRTIRALDVADLFAYLLHDADKIFENEIKDEFALLKHNRLIQYSGVSVYTNEQFEKAISADHIDVIQIPYNLLDNKNLRGELIEKAKQKNKIIHVRSVFLQGLFFMPEQKLPLKLQPLQNYIREINRLCKEFAISKEALALNYALDDHNIDGVLAGVDSVVQLQKNIEAALQIIPGEITRLINQVIVKETNLLNPVNWN